MTWKISNDLPYLDEFPLLYQLSEYPNSLWRQINGELPYKIAFPELLEFNDAPNSLWRIKDNLPYKTVFPDLLKINDAPNCIWRVGNDIPYKVMFPELSEMGAFCHATNLKKVKIPRSVKKIGRFAFTYTQIKEVTISSDCEYYDTSFPKDCEIKFYE